VTRPTPRTCIGPLAQADDLDEILAWREKRTVTRNLTLHYDRMMLLLDPTPLARDLAGKKVEVVNYPDGRFAVQFNGTALDFKLFDKIQTVQPARSSTTSGCRPCWSTSRRSRPPTRRIGSAGTWRGGDRRTTSRHRVCRRRAGHLARRCRGCGLRQRTGSRADRHRCLA